MEQRLVFGYVLKLLSILSGVTFVGGSITMFEDSGRLGTDCWATDSAHPVFFHLQSVLSWLLLDPTLSISSATDQDALEFPLLSWSFGRLCSSSASAFFHSFSGAGSCCRGCSSSSCGCILRRNSSSCCCCCCCKRISCSHYCCSCCSCYCCKRNSPCWQRDPISSRSCSNSKCCSGSRCSVSFLALRFSSSILSIYRLLDHR